MNISFICLLLLAGCGRAEGDTLPKIRYGRDICDECRMIISEPQFAAAALDQNGNAVRFDEIGCLVSYGTKHALEIKKTWTHDYRSESWLRADQALFVKAEKLVTPMGFGLVAFLKNDGALQFARDYDGTIVSWDDLPEIVQKEIEHVS